LAGLELLQYAVGNEHADVLSRGGKPAQGEKIGDLPLKHVFRQISLWPARARLIRHAGNLAGTCQVGLQQAQLRFGCADDHSSSIAPQLLHLIPYCIRNSWPPSGLVTPVGPYHSIGVIFSEPHDGQTGPGSDPPVSSDLLVTARSKYGIAAGMAHFL
jgi:hypothetical protein